MISKNRVLFNSGRPLLRAENIKAVYKEYEGPKTFRKGSEVSEKILQIADVCCTDEFPTFKAKKSVMVTHGIPLTKKYGLDQKYPWFEPDCVDYVVAPSKYAVPIMAKQAGVPENRVLPLGMPRTDVYIGKVKGDGGTNLMGKRVYLYAPTFRNVRSGEGRLPNVDWAYIDSHLNDDELLVVKVHMRTGVSGISKNYKHILEVSNDVPSTPYLIDCDVLITDYSSILFDAHILRKPIVLFEKDSTRYLKERGMYLDYPFGYASNHCTSEGDLIQLCRTAERLELDEKCRLFATSACDGHAVERIVELISLL